MAAILFKSCGQGCKGLGECMSVPFRACCDISDLCCTPFTPYLVLTVVTCLPPAYMGLKATMVCEPGETHVTWLGVNALLSICHIVGATYIVYRMQQQQQQSMEAANDNTTPAVTGVAPPPSETNYTKAPAENNNSPPGNNHNWMRGLWKPSSDSSAMSWGRLGTVLCYDPGVALYLVAVIIWIFWQSWGWMQSIADVAEGEDNDDDDAQEDGSDPCTAGKWTGFSIVYAFVYMWCVICFFACSFCCLRSH